MATTTITRTSFTDDTGDGISGDVWNSTLIGTSIYDKIDALIANDLELGGDLYLPSGQQLGVGIVTGLAGTVHIQSGSVIAPGTNADDLVIESTSQVGVTILGPTDSDARIAFGDSADADSGRILYRLSAFGSSKDNQFEFYTAGALGFVISDSQQCAMGGLAVPLTNADLTLEGGALALKERGTPTADTNYGKLYTKSDNALYFQDGAGTEHTVTIT